MPELIASAARDVPERRIHGHDIDVAENEFTARRQADRSDVGGRPLYTFRLREKPRRNCCCGTESRQSTDEFAFAKIAHGVASKPLPLELACCPRAVGFPSRHSRWTAGVFHPIWRA